MNYNTIDIDLRSAEYSFSVKTNRIVNIWGFHNLLMVNLNKSLLRYLSKVSY